MTQLPGALAKREKEITGRILRWNDFSQLNQRYFMRNGLVSVVMFLCTWASYQV